VSTWFRYSFDEEIKRIGAFKRVSAALKGILMTVFSPKILLLIRVFILDVLIQGRLFKEDFLRWFMHMCLFWGFMSLLIVHSLDKLITSKLFTNYSSTLNPFLFLRNLFFVLILLGLGIAVYRRFFMKVPRLFSHMRDHFAIAILSLIMISGILLEGAKIVSYTKYQGMVEDYADTDESEALKNLESYWVENFGVVSPNVKGPFEATVLANGRELNETNCAACHSRPNWAFVSYGVSKAIKPVAAGLDRAGLTDFLWYVHFLACFIGLAYLPFSKMFHIFTSPLSLLANSVMDKEISDPTNITTRQIMELDACTHCGTCSLKCRVGICFEEIPNVNILPSEKLASVKALVAGKKLSDHELSRIQEGLYLCTNCTNCTVVCPVGINLQDLWFNVREAMLQKGYPELLTLSTLSFYRGLSRNGRGEQSYRKPIAIAKRALEEEFKLKDADNHTLNLTNIDTGFKKILGISNQGNTFSYCFTCKTCTVSCPVVRNFENPPKRLGLVPHQIIHAALLGVKDLIFSSDMLWLCLGCYQCQENCPQGVKVTDILYELKNMAMKHIKGGKTISIMREKS